MRLAWFGLLLLTGCESGDIAGYDALVRQVERSRVGSAPDHWIETLNLVGEWERTGLIFGYAEGNGDYNECQKAIAGLKKENYAREYRCVPAN